MTQPRFGSRGAVRAAAGLAWCLAHVLFASAASAQAPSDSELEAARGLARQGLAALSDRDFATAEDLLSRALAVTDAPIVRLARARARSGLGRLLAAVEDYRAAQRWPKAAGEPAIFATVRTDATRELGALEPKIPRLTVELRGQGTVRVAGVVWPAASLGSERLLDPGEYLVEATTARGETSRVNVRLRPGQREVTRLDLVELANQSRDASPPGSPPATAAAQETEPWPSQAVPEHEQTDPRAAPSPERHGGANYTAAWVVGGISAGLLVASLATGLRSISLNSEYDKINNDQVDMKLKQQKHDATVQMRWISTALMAGAFVGAGVTTYLVIAPSVETDSGRASLGAQATLTGRF